MTLCPNCAAPLPASPDGRAVTWRARIRLYDARDEVVADTDAERDAAAPGSVVVAGLPALAQELAALCEAFHGPCEGLDEATLKHALKSLRPTLSRRGGNAAWRVAYRAQGREWLARVDVEKVT